MIKKIEEAILGKLNGLEKIKLLAVPIVDFKEVRQSIIVNLQYISETFQVPNNQKAIFAPLPTKKRVSDINFSLTLYYKDLRNNFEDIYSTFDIITELLHGEQLEIEGLNLSPMYIKNIEFKERNIQNFIVYTCSLEIKYCKVD
jgi:hypothetical protein